MKEAIQDDFRQWYMEYKRVNGSFPEFPEESVWRQTAFKFSMEGVKAGAGTTKQGIKTYNNR